MAPVKRNKQSRRPEPLDDENPEWAAEDFRRAQPMADVFPEIVEAAKRARGRPRLEKPKEHISLRVDPDVLKAFKLAFSKGWQTRLAELMARAVSRANAASRREKPRAKGKRAA